MTARASFVPLGDREREVLRETVRLERSVFSFERYNRFQETLATGARTTGSAAPAAVICMCARTASSITARSSAAIPAFRLPDYTQEH